MLREWWEKLVRVEAGSPAGLLVFVVMAMSAVTVLSVFMGSYAIAGVFWVVFLVVVLLRATLIERAARLVVTTGATTPSAAQHSNIEAMEARGDYARAAKAYRDAIATDPKDVVACEKLGRLAMGHLKDYDTAIWAFRQAEDRTAEPRRKLGYAMLVLGIFRDDVRDAGRTIVEGRRLLARWPDAPNAAALRAELDALKQEHFKTT